MPVININCVTDHDWYSWSDRKRSCILLEKYYCREFIVKGATCHTEPFSLWLVQVTP